VTRQLRVVALAMFMLFVLLFINVNIVQVVQANFYRERDAARQLIADYSVRRGSIRLADGTEIARADDTGGNLRFTRSYPGGELYAPVTGFFSRVYGATGLEATQDEWLSGDRVTIPTLADLLEEREDQGDDVVTTIRPRVQEAARRALGNNRGAVVALDPRSGDVLAMWGFPSYDPNLLASENRDEVIANRDALLNDPGNPLENRAVRGFYPPGSVFKIVTTAAALEAGIPPDQRFDDVREQPLPPSDAVIRNFGGGLCNGGQPLTLEEAFTVSCNTTFAQLAYDPRVGGAAIAEQAEAFGFTQDLGGQIPELEPSVAPIPDNDPPVAAQSALGQRDVRVTPLQMAAIVGAVANGGIMRVPRLVRQIEDRVDGSPQQQFNPSDYGRPISRQTADTLRQFMVNVVEEGTGEAAQIPGVQVAGKTGTAETGVDGGPPTVWFVGFAPADNPTVAVAVVLENVAGVGNEATGGRLAAPIGRQVLEQALAEPESLAPDAPSR
jgi:penicillin-binding protein A